MRKQVELLIKLHDIDLLIRELDNPEARKKFRKMGFKLKEPSIEFLKARQQLAKKLPPKILKEYERIMHRYKDRAVVPVLNEFCGGCYVKLPSEFLSRRKEEIQRCPNCGRFLYWLK